MAYKLVVNEYAYSAESMRAWLLLDAFGFSFGPRYVPMLTEEHDSELSELTPARSFPVVLMDTPDLPMSIWEHAAMADILFDRQPNSGIWPQNPEMKEVARSLAARAREGFPSLQNLPMNLHDRYQGFVPSDVQKADVQDLAALWGWALRASGGPFLCGREFCAADAAFAPLASRLVTYDFEMDEATRSYVEAIYAHPSMRRWLACADAQLRRIEDLHLDLPVSSNKEWPRQPTLPSERYYGDIADAINRHCPYSGLPVDAESLAHIDGVIVGFCNQFCCRRGMADAESWPSVMAVMHNAALTRTA